VSAPVSNGDEPRWIRDGIALWLSEIRLLFVTIWTFISAPRRFGAEWASGKLVAMNPVGVVLASATVLLPADYGLQRLLRWDQRPNISIAIELARASRPYLLSALLGLLIHLALRLLGSRRMLSTTIGILFYVTVWSWAAWCVGLVVCYFAGLGSAVPTLMAGATLLWAALALDGAHRVRWYWCLGLLIVVGFGLIQLINLMQRYAGLS